MPANLPTIRTCATLAASALILALVAYPAGCGSSGGGKGKEIETRPPAEFNISAVQDLGTVEQNAIIKMRDCGYSAKFQGKSVWIYGDTILATASAENRRMLCNSWSSTFDFDAGDGLAGFDDNVDDVGAPRTFIPFTADENQYNERHAGESCAEEPCGSRWAIWPGAIVVDDPGNTAYVFYSKVRIEPGLLNFHQVGNSIAVWENISQPARRPEFRQYENYPTLLFSGGWDGFGSAALRLGNTVYSYSCELYREALSKPCRLGRVHIANILDREAWTFYAVDGNWSGQVEDARALFSGNEMMSVFYNTYLQQYLAVYSQPMDTRAMVRTAPAPEGPWSGPRELFVTRETGNEFGWIYDVLAHPELAQDNGRIMYLTYTRQTAPGSSEMRLVSVEVERQF